jgi:hypothetical protein
MRLFLRKIASLGKEYETFAGNMKSIGQSFLCNLLKDLKNMRQLKKNISIPKINSLLCVLDDLDQQMKRFELR